MQQTSTITPRNYPLNRCENWPHSNTQKVLHAGPQEKLPNMTTREHKTAPATFWIEKTRMATAKRWRHKATGSKRVKNAQAATGYKCFSLNFG